ncbi:MAG: glycoside hydrolase family 3 N-terminal domain-containing protein [Thermoproteota archaeon]|nr:glycoside hydrolase family 3 protein [Candidatus Brockarchaeota archaeon]MBO3800958.1 glycoside hydrolase family 3 protein [Candidatus Brockarchaeota archaeon]
MNQKSFQKFNLEQQVSELFMVRINSDNLTSKDKKTIEDITPGGFLFSSKTISNVKAGKELCKELERIVQSSTKKITPFFAVEHEGGEIFALPQEATPIPSAMAIGATGLTNFAYTTAYITALELRAIGINMNFSPLIEPASLNNCRLSRSRNFWDDPQSVERFVLKYIRGLRNGGIISIAKYFPSCSLAKENNDNELEIDIEDIKQALPLLKRITSLSKVDGLMILNATIVDRKQKKTPAFLSKEVVKEILAKDLSYHGLLITELLSENKNINEENLEDIAIKAIEVGNDILVIDENFENLQKLKDAVVKEAKENPLLAGRIKKAFSKVIKKKTEYLEYFRKPTLQVIGCKKHRNEVEKITRKSVGLVFDEGLLPLKPRIQNIVILVFADIETYDLILSLVEEFEFKKTNVFLANEENTPLVTTKVRKANAVIIFSQNLFNKTKERINVDKVIEQNEKSILISVSDPYDVMFVRKPYVYIVAYSPDFYSIKSALEVVTGRLKPNGKIPKSLAEIINNGR